MESKILGVLCRKCQQLVGINDKNHKCSTMTAPPQFSFKTISPKFPSPSVSNLNRSSPISNFMSNLETEDSDSSSVSESHNEDDEFYSNLIVAVYERSPLWDHRLPISARYEPIKQKLWNEIYVTLNGIYPIETLKKKWLYLREKYVRENRKPASGAAGGNKKIWCHMSSLNFLKDVITNSNKCTTNIKTSEESPDSEREEPVTKRTKRPKIDSFEEAILKELCESRPVPPTPPVKNDQDGDFHFCNYLVSLMKNMPQKKKLTLQSEFISRVIENLED